MTSTQSSTLVWHYTIGLRWLQIRQDGVIKPATGGVPLLERACVWFTSFPDFEPTATKGAIENGVRRGLTIAETELHGLGLYRIGVGNGSAPHDFRAYQELSGATRQTVGGLVRAAKNAGSDPRTWRVSFEPVRREQWLRVEKRDGHNWVAQS